MCDCCGRIVNFLFWLDPTDGKRKTVACYAKGWDGNPWYTPGTHARHPRKRYALFKRKEQEERQDPDPFFRLD